MCIRDRYRVAFPTPVTMVPRNLILQRSDDIEVETKPKRGEGSLHPRPKGQGIRDPPHSRSNKPYQQILLKIKEYCGKWQNLKSETFLLGHVEKGQEITKVLFWGLKEDFGKDSESYKAQLFVKNGSEILDSRNLSFSYRSPILSKLKLIDFSADSEKASALIILTSSTNLRSVQVPEPSVIDPVSYTHLTLPPNREV